MRHRLLTAAVAASLALSLSPAVADAAPSPLTGVELNTTVANSVAVDATFDYGAARETGLPALRKLRGQMWDRNPYFNDSSQPGSTRLQDVARQHGLETKEAYVNAVAIDDGLTRIAIQRAGEQYGELNHQRPDGSLLWGAKVDGQQTWAESLGGGATLEHSIMQGWGHGELAKLNSNRGAYAPGNGHLHMMINPKNKYYGFGEVFLPGTKWGTYTAAATSETPGNSAPMATGMQRVWLYRPAKPGENPTGVKQGTPGPVKKVPGDSAGISTGLGGSSEDINNIIGIVFGILSLLGVVASIARQLGLI